MIKPLALLGAFQETVIEVDVIVPFMLLGAPVGSVYRHTKRAKYTGDSLKILRWALNRTTKFNSQLETGKKIMHG